MGADSVSHSPPVDATPASELAHRAAQLGARIAGARLDGVLVAHPSSVFWISGTLADGFAWVGGDGRTALAVRRNRTRARMESPLLQTEIRHPGDLPAALDGLGVSGRTRVGLELDVLPVATFERLTRAFPETTFVDASPIVRETRAIKTSYEIAWIERAAESLRVVMDERLPAEIRPGVPEIEVMAFIEHELRLRRHQGTIRMRRWNMEMHFGLVSCGPSALHPCSFDGPDGLEALYPAIQQGGGERRLTSHAPILVDFVGAQGGYLADRTRIFSIGEPPREALEAHEACRSILRTIESLLRPGAVPSAIHARALEIAGSTRWASGFMGWGTNRVGFVGHGIGLDLDELPVLAPRFEAPLVPGHVLAIEPKIFLEGIGGVGVENSYVVTEDGFRNLTPGPEEIRVV